MDIKEVGNAKVDTSSAHELCLSKKQSHRSDNQNPAQHAKDAADRVDLELHAKGSDLRERANAAVSALNITSLATEEIGKILGGVKGIVEQANTDGISGRQLDLLEREANDLVAAIKELAKSTHANGVNPLAGDKIKLEVEEKLGKTLEFILPDDAADSFGLQDISFSSKDLIIATITKVSVAQQQYEQLRRSVDQTGIEIKKTVAELEGLLRSSEASDAILADVDQAFHLAEKTKKGISAKPEVAMGSVGGVNRRSVSMLD